MPDPIDPTFEEDVAHVDGAPPKFDLPPSTKHLAAQACERQSERQRNELAEILSTEAGQSFIMRILHQCHIYYDGKLNDEAQGRRMLGVKIIKEITALGPDNYPNLLANHARRAQRIRDEESAIATNAKSKRDEA